MADLALKLPPEGVLGEEEGSSFHAEHKSLGFGPGLDAYMCVQEKSMTERQNKKRRKQTKRMEHGDFE